MKGGGRDGCRGSHLRDVGWVTKSYQVAEERGSITEHQVQSHQADDTCRHEEGSGSGGTQALQPGSPRQHRKAWPVLGIGEKPHRGWARAFSGLCLWSGDTGRPHLCALPSPVPPARGPMPRCAPAAGAPLPSRMVWAGRDSGACPQPLPSRTQLRGGSG